MLSQTHFLSWRPLRFNKCPSPAKMATTSRAPFSVRVRSSATPTPVAGDTIPAPVTSEHQTPNFSPPSQSLVAASPPVAVARSLGLRPTPELGLLSHLFVLSMAFGAFFSVAVVSIPTLIAFGRLGASVKKLSKVVSEEVPGTLSSLKLSSMELNELTQQLSSLSLAVSGIKLLAIPQERRTGAMPHQDRFVRTQNPNICQHCLASFAWSGTGILLRRVTLEDEIKDLFSEFEGSIFQSLTSHTCYRENCYDMLFSYL